LCFYNISRASIQKTLISIKSWFSTASAENRNERKEKPVKRAYSFICILALVTLLLPAAAFVILAGLVLPGAMDNGWVLLGFAGGVVAGVGLFNLVAAWMHQYLGHWFTLGCLLLGGILMAVSWGILA
jgi:uncharacterized RDD family membrane protein YckC